MLSRRRFLQLAGIAVAARSLPNLAFPASAPTFDPVYGRALVSTPVYAAPDTAAPLLKHLWSDTVLPIFPADNAWYRLRRGYAQRAHIQPMLAPAQRSSASFDPPFWAEVTGSIAVVRAWCDISAPVITRIGHGGVLRVIDRLPGEGIDWYSVAAEDDTLIGWSMAAVWSPTAQDRAAADLTLAVDRQQLAVYRGDVLLLRAPISTGCSLVPGVYPISDRQMTITQADHYGAGWVQTFGSDLPLHLSGVYWHNQFGTPTPGAALQVTPPLARWLYPRATTVIIS